LEGCCRRPRSRLTEADANLWMRRASHTHPENTTCSRGPDVLRIHRLPAAVSRSTVDHAQAVGDDNPQCPSPLEVEVTMPDTQKPEDSPTEDEIGRASCRERV